MFGRKLKSESGESPAVRAKKTLNGSEDVQQANQLDLSCSSVPTGAGELILPPYMESADSGLTNSPAPTPEGSHQDEGKTFLPVNPARIDNGKVPQADDNAKQALPMDDCGDAIARQVAEILAKLSSLQQKIDSFDRVPQLLEAQINSVAKVDERFRSSIITPIAKEAIGWYDKLDWIQSQFRGRHLDTVRDSQVLNQLLDELLNAGGMILDSLCSYGVERILPLEGDLHDRDKHHVNERRKTNKQELDGRIAECLDYGFQEQSTKRILKPANVIVYKFENSVVATERSI